MPDICIFGEVLFDCFPDGSRVLGGAPFNVAWNLQALGAAPRFVSRVGDDEEGRQVRAAMDTWGLDTGGLQIDRQRPTGRVQVEIVDGEPRYDIVRDSAWDAIEALAQPPCELLYHGSLAVRSSVSAAALRELRRYHRGKVFIDVNLRPPWWRIEALDDLLRGAHWVKLNAEELGHLQGEATGSEVPEIAFLERHGLQGLVLTRGGAGAELLTLGGERWSVSPEPQTAVVDTVGAGDAFASVMLLGLLRGWSAPLTLSRAQELAAAVVGLRGATAADPGFYGNFRSAWGLEAQGPD